MYDWWKRLMLNSRTSGSCLVARVLSTVTARRSCSSRGTTAAVGRCRPDQRDNAETDPLRARNALQSSGAQGVGDGRWLRFGERDSGAHLRLGRFNGGFRRTASCERRGSRIPSDPTRRWPSGAFHHPGTGRLAPGYTARASLTTFWIFGADSPALEQRSRRSRVRPLGTRWPEPLAA